MIQDIGREKDRGQDQEKGDGGKGQAEMKIIGKSIKSKLKKQG